MASYAYLFIDNRRIYSFRNNLTVDVEQLFTKDQLSISSGKAADKLAETLHGGEPPISGFDKDNPLVLLQCDVKAMRQRLNLLGYGESSIREAFDAVREYQLEWKEKFARTYRKQIKNEHLEDIKYLKHLSYGKWLDDLAQALSNMENIDADSEWTDSSKSLPTSLLENMEHTIVLLILINIVNRGILTLDVSEFYHEGWLELQDFGPRMLNVTGLAGTAPIIITEGVFDTFVLSKTIQLLYPQLDGYIKFLDTSYKTEGGAGAVVKMVKSFAAANISNRILAIFDNDTSAHDALESLKNNQLPPHFRVTHYPDLEFARLYPTLGPQGLGEIDINGLACSIELYLGDDVIKDEHGEFYPIQWTGFNQKTKTYQGEVTYKAEIQKKFEAKVKAAKGKKKLEGSEWDNLRLIFDHIIRTLSE